MLVIRMSVAATDYSSPAAVLPEDAARGVDDRNVGCESGMDVDDGRRHAFGFAACG